jgi:hypothetical protein
MIRARPGQGALARGFATALLALLAIPGPDEKAEGALPRDPTALFDALEAAWTGSDVEAYLALWEFEDEDARRRESDFASDRFAAEEHRLVLERPVMDGATTKAVAHAQLFFATEPRGQVEQMGFVVEARGEGFVITQRRDHGQIDGLVHLSLDRGGFRAAGLTLRLPDFELAMQQGTLFLSPEKLGPTVLVFVGQANVKVAPGPPAEREQMRVFCGRPEMMERIKTAFVRIHPADLHRVLEPMRLEPDPDAGARWKEAQDFYQDQASRAFVLDAPLPRSPWWLMPSLGDALVSFRSSRGVLTFTLSRGEAEDVSFFNREKRTQVLLYSSEGRRASYSEDDGRVIDILSHDLRVRFDPDRLLLRGEDVMDMDLLQPAASLRLRLDDALRVISVSSAEGGSHLFFRVRGQDSVVVSLGPHSGRTGPLRLRVRYAGALDPAPVEDESMQASLADPNRGLPEEDIFIERVLLYTNKNAWYPRNLSDDHARYHLRLDIPEDFIAISGGKMGAYQVEGGRRFMDYRQEQPGKYLSVVLGRLVEVGAPPPGTPALRAFAVRRQKNLAIESLDRARRIFDFFTRMFGPCPYADVNLAFTENMSPGGHSPPGLVLVQVRPALAVRNLRDDPANFSDIPGFFLAHEIAHQWWGQGVGPQNYRERWLAEGAAQYAAALWIRESRGEEAFQAVLKRFGDWALRHARAGPLSLGYRIGHIRSDGQAYRAVVYDKGAYVFQMLRLLVGDEAFRRALVDYQEQNRYKKSGSRSLRDSLEKASGQDLGPYFAEWVDGVSIPDLRLAYDIAPTGTAFRTTVRVSATGLPASVPLEVSLLRAGERDVRLVRLEAAGGEFTFETPDRPARVEINAGRALLARVRGPD